MVQTICEFSGMAALSATITYPQTVRKIKQQVFKSLLNNDM
jgi:hypothetical protein